MSPDRIDHPATAFRRWYRELAPPIQDEIARLAFGRSSDLVDVRRGPPAEALLKWLEATGNDHERFLRLLIVRAYLEFLVMRPRASNWARSAESLRRVGETATDVDDAILTFAEKALRELPFREKQWMRIVESWRDICAGALSDTALESWLSQWVPEIPELHD